MYTGMRAQDACTNIHVQESCRRTPAVGGGWYLVVRTNLGGGVAAGDSTCECWVGDAGGGWFSSGPSENIDTCSIKFSLHTKVKQCLDFSVH